MSILLLLMIGNVAIFVFWSRADNTWEPEEHLENSQALLASFNEKKLGKKNRERTFKLQLPDTEDGIRNQEDAPVMPPPEKKKKKRDGGKKFENAPRMVAAGSHQKQNRGPKRLKSTCLSPPQDEESVYQRRQEHEQLFVRETSVKSSLILQYLTMK